jgi:selT/selW/selH-like putative selenoprotein
MFGDKLLPAIGVVPPPIYYKLKEKQWMVIIGSYFLTSQLSNSLLNSGAFEVYLNGELVHSKLTSKQMPDPLVLAGMIKRMLTQ